MRDCTFVELRVAAHAFGRAREAQPCARTQLGGNSTFERRVKPFRLDLIASFSRSKQLVPFHLRSDGGAVVHDR